MHEPLPTRERILFSDGMIRAVMHDLGIDVKANEGSKEIVTRCVFHNDSEGGKPNLYINVGDKCGVIHCFRCDYRGTFYDYVEVRMGLSPFQTAAYLNKFRGRFPDPPFVAPKAHLTNDVLAKYAYRHPYCYERGLSEDTLKRYRVGYDREQNVITIPWYDRVGELKAIKHRSVLDKAYYVTHDGPVSHLLFGLHLVRPRSIVWITEGEFDAMYLDQCFRQTSFTQHFAIALGGKVLQQKALEQLSRKSPVRIVLALDNDLAGEDATLKISSDLAGYDRTVLHYDEAKDPNGLPLEAVVRYAQQVETDVLDAKHKQQKRYEDWKLKNNVH